jgi:serine/threonine protein kinase
MESIHRLELKRKIATGGMGDVYLAVQYGDGGFERQVIVKRLHRHLAEQPGPLMMFQEEAMLLARLGHPGFPAIFDYRLHRTGWYIAMEFIEGPSLEELLLTQRGADKPLPLEMALGIVAQAAAAIHHAHELQTSEGRRLEVIHGDLAPGNILIHRNGVVKIIDFGVARTADNASLANRLQGTLRYMSPEQIRARPSIGPHADIFALGVLLYELSTGQRPFDGSDIEVMTKVASAEYRAPTELIPEFPPKLASLIASCLALNPDDRPVDAAELTWAIHDLAQDLNKPIDPNTLADRLASILPNKRKARESIPSRIESSPSEPEEIQFESWTPEAADPHTGDAGLNEVILQSFVPQSGLDDGRLTAASSEDQNPWDDDLLTLGGAGDPGEEEEDVTLTAASELALFSSSEPENENPAAEVADNEKADDEDSAAEIDSSVALDKALEEDGSDEEDESQS